MFYEIRTYQLNNGHSRLSQGGLRVRHCHSERHLGNLVGYFSSEIGPVNEIVHICSFATLDDRQARRARLAADAAWQAFLPKIRDLIVTADNKIMSPTAFSPLGGTTPA